MRPQHHSKRAPPMDRPFYCTNMDTSSIKQMEDVCGLQRCRSTRRNVFCNVETCAVSIKSCWSNIKRNWTYVIIIIHTMVGLQWFWPEPTSWPLTEVNTPTDNLELRNVRVALVYSQEDITQGFSKLNKLIRVIAYFKRFIDICRQPKANRQTTILSTQDLDKALTCCMKMVQQISYAQEFEELVKHKEVSANSSVKTLHPFIDQEGLLRVGGWLQQYSLPFEVMHLMILPPNRRFPRLVVSAEHKRLHRAGPELLTASLRERYWIPWIRIFISVWPVINSRYKDHNSSWESYHQLESNLRELPLPQA
jgi:hypothetical protein